MAGVPLRAQNPDAVRVAPALPLVSVTHGELSVAVPPPEQDPVIDAPDTGLPKPSFRLNAMPYVLAVAPALLEISVGFAVRTGLPTLIATLADSPATVKLIVAELPGCTPDVTTVVSTQPDAPVGGKAPAVKPFTVPVPGDKLAKLKLMITPGIGLPTLSFKQTATVWVVLPKMVDGVAVKTAGPIPR